MGNKIQYILRNINILNILLLTVAFIWAYYGILPLFTTEIQYAAPDVRKVERNRQPDPLIEQEPSFFSEYGIIAEKNAFHPNRVIPPLEAEKKDNQSLPRPDIILYGTIISDSASFAHLEDRKSPISTPGRGKKLRVMKKGESISGFAIKEIFSDRIVLVRGNDNMTVYLDSPRKERQK